MSKQKLPQQANPISPERTAVAPYNFVPLPDQVVPAEQQCAIDQSVYHADRHTGHIACTLTTETPLYVRCALTTAQFRQAEEEKKPEHLDEQRDWRQLAKNTPDFFYTANVETPVIPGSSLRGMLRALVEIVSYGKMDRVTDQQHYFFRAVAAKTDDPLAKPYRNLLKSVRAGYLIQRGQDWFICPAQTIGIDSFIKVRERDIPHSLSLIRMNESNYRPQYIEVSFTHKRTPNGRIVVDRIDKIGVYPNRGWLVTSGNMLETNRTDGRTNRKNHVVVLERGTGEIPIDRQAVIDYRSGLTEFQKGPTDIQPINKRPFSEQMGMLKDGRPVFFCEPVRGEAIHFFGHSPNFRVPYWRRDVKHAATPIDLIPLEIRRGQDDTNQPPVTDIAEALFGHVSRNTSDDSRKPIAGRVFFSDAVLQSEQENVLYNEPLTPQILATPKPTTFQHYLVQTQPERIQTGTVVRGNPIYQLPLAHYQSNVPDETVARGHKLYWHKGGQPDIKLPSYQLETNESQKTRIRPVKPGTIFTFTIHFENLSDRELGSLLWVLQLAADDRYRLSLGMGKPLGMGAVKIESKVVLSNREERYTTLFSEDGWAMNERGITSEEKVEFVSAFTQYVLRESGEAEYGISQLSDTLRMQCLLALLAWSGLPEEQTSYMQIEIGPGRINQYKERRVLPSPLQVIGAPFPNHSLMQSNSQNIPSAIQSTDSAKAQAEIIIPIIGDIVTGNRSGLIREPIRGVKVDINKKWYRVKPGVLVIGVVRTEDAGGMVSGGFRGEVVGRHDDEKNIYLFLMPTKSNK